MNQYQRNFKSFVFWIIPQIGFIFLSFLAFYQFTILTFIPLKQTINEKQEFNTFFQFMSYFITFHSILWLWSFISLYLRDPGSMLKEKKSFNSKANKKCQKCGLPKPFRAHHCSKCNKCFARMDHHCTLFGKCIALRNQKIFVLSAFYSFLLSMSWFILSILYSFLNWKHLTNNQTAAPLAALFMTIFFFNKFHEQIHNIINGKTILEKQFSLKVSNNNRGVRKCFR